MSFSYFKILLRRIGKEKVFYTIIISNLAIGYFAFIIVSQFISGEFNWDKHNLNYDRIARLQLFMDQEENSITHSSSVTAALSRNDLKKIPEIEKIALIHDVGDNNKSGVFLSPDKDDQYLIRYGYYADPEVFDIFTFDFIEGDKNSALLQPYSIVLSKTLAVKLFPDGNALGKQVYGENKVSFTVTGIYRDLPVRSTWQPVYLIPMALFTPLTGFDGYESNYYAYSFFTYVLLRPGTTAAQVDPKIHDALKDYRKEHYPYLRPMDKLHLNPYFQNDLYISVVIFSFIGLLILVLSSINFINLQTANATSRFKEIGIKKTLGFDRKRLWTQFLGESLVLSIVAALAGLVLANAAIPAMRTVIGADVLDDISGNWKLISIILSVTVITGLLSGMHPAYVISSYKPVAALKQKAMLDESNGITLKKVLVTLQFVISVLVLIAGIITYRQTRYMLTKDMGFESQHLLFSNIVTNKKGSTDALRNALLEHNEIQDFCHSDYIPFILPGGDDLVSDEADPTKKVFVRFSDIDYDFLSTFKIKLISGRNFSREYPADDNKCLINETAARIFNFKEGSARKIKTYKGDFEVIGVLKDYVAFSVHNPIEPHMYMLIQDSILNDKVYTVRFAEGKEKEAMKIVREEFTNFFPEDAFEFKNIQTLIQNENAVKAWKSFRQICGLVAVITIIISSIGLFGLMLFLTRKKMKEIGIRKILGFSTGSLYINLSSGFLKLLVISIAMSWPAAYYYYRILPGADKYGLQVWEFIIATSLILLVALITITWQIMKAIRVRPVEILKEDQ